MLQKPVGEGNTLSLSVEVSATELRKAVFSAVMDIEALETGIDLPPFVHV